MTSLAQCVQALAQQARPAYVPEVSAQIGAPTGSRYFGQPWLPVGTPWPGEASRAFSFVLQLNTAELPAPWGTPPDQARLMLFFYDERMDESAFLVVDPSLEGGVAVQPNNLQGNPPLAITAWHPVTDHVWTEDFDTVFGDDAEAFSEFTEELDSGDIDTVLGTDGQTHTEKEAVQQGVAVHYHCYECDKLGGHPRWEQGNDTPEDENGNPMRFVFQLGHRGLFLGDVPADLAWPTWGRGQIFTSDATGEWAYVWACD